MPFSNDPFILSQDFYIMPMCFFFGLPYFERHLFLFSYLSSMRTQRSLKCLFRCFFCLFLRFFFSIFLCAFSSISKPSGGRIMWGKRASSWGLPPSSALRGSSWRKGSSRGDSSWWSSNAGEAEMKDDLLVDKYESI